jgi:hypothetical protein
VPVRRRAACLAAVAIAAACGRGAMRPLRVAVTESGGDLTLMLEEPVRAVRCVTHDYRRAPGDPAAVRDIWSARCTAGAACATSILYGDRSLESLAGPEPLTPSEPGLCYECELTGDHGRALTRFRIAPRGGFEPCVPY